MSPFILTIYLCLNGAPGHCEVAMKRPVEAADWDSCIDAGKMTATQHWIADTKHAEFRCDVAGTDL